MDIRIFCVTPGVIRRNGMNETELSSFRASQVEFVPEDNICTVSLTSV